jgi:hypothetical protein
MGINLSGDSNLIHGCTILNNTAGIFMYGGGSISGNITTNCGTGIACYAVGRIIGNTIISNSGQTGILLSPNVPILLDQNAVGGDGVHYSQGGSATVWGMNAGSPPHMNYPSPY